MQEGADNMDLLEIIRGALWHFPEKFFHMADQSFANGEYAESITEITASIGAGILAVIFSIWATLTIVNYFLVLVIYIIKGSRKLTKKGTSR